METCFFKLSIVQLIQRDLIILLTPFASQSIRAQSKFIDIMCRAADKVSLTIVVDQQPSLDQHKTTETDLNRVCHSFQAAFELMLCIGFIPLEIPVLKFAIQFILFSRKTTYDKRTRYEVRTRQIKSAIKEIQIDEYKHT